MSECRKGTVGVLPCWLIELLLVSVFADAAINYSAVRWSPCSLAMIWLAFLLALELAFFFLWKHVFPSWLIPLAIVQTGSLAVGQQGLPAEEWVEQL